MKTHIDEDQLKPEGIKHQRNTPRDSGNKGIDFERKDAHREKIQDNAQIRALVVKALGERKMLYEKKIVVKVDNDTVYRLGELDNIQLKMPATEPEAIEKKWAPIRASMAFFFMHREPLHSRNGDVDKR